MNTENTARITTEWTAALIRDGLEPDEHQLGFNAGTQPIVRIHFAFAPRLSGDARDSLVMGVGSALAHEMQLAAEDQATAIPSEVANHVLFSQGHGGYPAGSFTTRLLDTWGYADDTNAVRLAASWPDYGAAFDLLRQPDGIARLTAIANGTA